MRIRKNRHLFFLLLPCLYSFSQEDSTIQLRFDFNDHTYREANDQLTIKPVGATLTTDRFGNKNSAVYIHGNPSSYINLGTSDLLKPRRGTVAMWVNLQNVMLVGKGYRGNPFVSTRSAPGDDFNITWGMGYSWDSKRFGGQVSKDSLREITVFSKDVAQPSTWYHIAITFDDDYFAYYQNGELQNRLAKGFVSNYFEDDSVVLGRSIGHKNERFANAIFDDICIYHRVLSDGEIAELFHEQDPNHIRTFFFGLFKYGIVIVILCAIIVIIVIRNRIALKKQKEYYELNHLHHKIRELEIKVLKTQMNPHFISNCLSAIQNLIYTGQIDKAGEYLANFNVFLRKVLDSSDKHYLSLDEEIRIIKLNVELEQLRFRNNFEFNLLIQEDLVCEDVLLPSLISQPFIENAIWHGLLPLKKREPRLTISVYSTAESTCLSIEDNGVGRSDTGPIASKKSRGLKLAADKIESINQFRNSNDFKLEIIDLVDENKLPAGTRVLIHLFTDLSDT